MFGDMNKDNIFPMVKFRECAIIMLKGPFGSDMKKELYVPNFFESIWNFYMLTKMTGQARNADSVFFSHTFYCASYCPKACLPTMSYICHAKH